MPIEFNCTHCSNRLRVPDDSAGKKARCPKCQQVADVPATIGSPLGRLSPQQQPGRQQGNPFGESAPTKTFDEGPASEDSVNPYTSPAGHYTPVQGEAAQKGEQQHRHISFSKVLDESWTIFGDNMGAFALATLIVLGLVIVVSIPLTLIQNVIVHAMAFNAGDPLISVIAATGVGAITGVLNTLVASYFYAGLAWMAVKAGRGHRAEVQDLFAAGPYYMRVAGAYLLLFLVSQVFNVIMVLPLVLMREPTVVFLAFPVVMIILSFVTMTFLLTPHFIVDCDMSLMESLSASARYMNGNRLAAFGVTFVAALLGSLFAMITCGIGTLLAWPFLFLMWGVVYLHATGQQTAVEFRRNQAYG